ncbi:aldo/keto reductase [Lentzea chajnantorensis]
MDSPLPPLAVGTMYFGTRVPAAQAHVLLDHAIELGASFVDTANNYAFWHPGATGDESENCIGDWLVSRRRRDRVTLATKAGARPSHPGGDLSTALGLSAPAVTAQVEASLRRLRTDHVDLVYAHVDDRSVALEETVGALQDLVARGLTRAIACSNTSAARLSAALALPGPRYAAVQNRFTYLQPDPGHDPAPHVLLDDEVLAAASAGRVLPVAHSVLLGGAYTRQDRPLPAPYLRPGTAAALSVLDDVAAEHDLDAGQAVLAWMVRRPAAVLPIVGCSTPAQLESAWRAVHTPLSDRAVEALEAGRSS